jgi:16S rRNA (cytosine1402-N4)-methyltransferase
VNDELGEIGKGLLAAEQLLKTGGVLAAISFHSLEDRLVKTFITSRSQAPATSRHAPEVKVAPSSFKAVQRKALVAGEEEVRMNPRSRSAKLRVAERTDAPAHHGDPLEALLAKVPSLDGEAR